MKRGAIFLLLVLLLSASVSAVEYIKLLDERMKSPATVTVEGQNFTVYAINLEKARVTFPNGVSEILGPTECKLEGYLGCVDLISKGTDDEFDFETFTYPTFVTFRIEKIKQEFEIMTSQTRDTMLPGEFAGMTIEWSNVGGLEYSSVSLAQEYPSNVAITNMQGSCLVSGSTVIWNGPLVMGATKKCTYRIQSYTPQVMEPTITLTYDGKSVTETPTFTIENPPLGVTTNFTRTSLDVGDALRIDINLENTRATDSLEGLIYSLTVPSSFKLVNIDNMEQVGDNVYRYSGSLGGDESINLTAELIVGDIGEYFVAEAATYQTSSNRNFRHDRSFGVNVSTALLTMVVDSPSWLAPGGYGVLKARIRNTNDVLKFRRLKLSATGDVVFEKSGYSILELFPQETYTWEVPVTVPRDAESMNVDIKLVYETEQGLTQSIKRTISKSFVSGDVVDEEPVEIVEIVNDLEPEIVVDALEEIENIPAEIVVEELDTPATPTGPGALSDLLDPSQPLFFIGMGTVLFVIAFVLILLLMRRNR